MLSFHIISVIILCYLVWLSFHISSVTILRDFSYHFVLVELSFHVISITISCLIIIFHISSVTILSSVYICEHCVCKHVREHVWKIYFSMNFRRTSGKWRINCAGSYVKNVGEIGKSSHKHGREQKFRQTLYHWAANILCVHRKKLTGDGSQWTVHKHCTNYTNLVFANKMFTSVYAA